jgi:hypothetical protein
MLFRRRSWAPTGIPYLAGRLRAASLRARTRLVGALLLGVGLAILLAACTRIVTHEPGSVGHDGPPETQGSVSFGNSQDAPAYDGSWEAKAHVDAGASGTTHARGVIHANVPNGYNGFYGAAFYFPPGTLDGPSPKQTSDIDIMGWGYAQDSEFGAIRIGSDHKARLIRGKTGQAPDTIGSSFSLQEGCWNWIAVRQKLSDKQATDPAHAVNRVYLDGERVVDSQDPNNFGHGADDMRFGLVSVATPDQDQALDVYVDNSYVSSSEIVAPGQKVCNPISGAQPSTIGLSAQTPLSDATKFLYTGDFPTQHGVADGTIAEQRAAVIHGRVLNRSSQSLAGARVIVVDHPELGYTTTRPDGTFYMAVNGGGQLRVRFEKEGYLPVERQLEVPWQDYSPLDDIVMTPLDDHPADIDLSQGPSIQVAQGNPATNSDGKATVFFQQGATATMKLPDGSSQPITQPMTVRATEYTVGPDGPKAMPAELPPTSAYTYAVGVTVDQAQSVGATEVDVDPEHPAISYTDNFLGFPVGRKVPAGVFDAAAGAWEPTKSGVVVKILSENGDVAQLDVDGSNQPASQSQLDALGISDNERSKLAALYQTDDELWRVTLQTLAAVDFNWGKSPDGATVARQSPLFLGDRKNNDCTTAGSIIECEDQVLGEHQDLTGSDFGMSYRSDRPRPSGRLQDQGAAHRREPAREPEGRAAGGRRRGQSLQPALRPTAGPRSTEKQRELHLHLGRQGRLRAHAPGPARCDRLGRLCLRWRLCRSDRVRLPWWSSDLELHPAPGGHPLARLQGQGRHLGC